MREVGVLAWAESLRAAGRIGEFGFSFHDSYDAFTEIVDGYDWTFCQIQYNFVNEDVQAGTKGLAYAAARGLAVVIMEPLFGGTLANPPPAVEEIYRSPPVPVRPADLALRWLWNKPEVSLVLSGMNQRAQVEQNIASAVQSGVGRLTSDEAALVGRLQEKYRDLSPIPCTRCGYCLPCPHGVNIPRNFELLNNARVFGGSSGLLCRNLYLLLPEAERASACEFCGTCEERCPQHIDIPAQLRAVHQQFQPSP
jgi:hypothetical protein